MIAIKVDNATHEAISYNTHIEDGTYQLWIARPNGKNLKIAEGTQAEMEELKSALDYAVEHNKRIFKIS
jgi:hypothetical protein